MDSSSMFSLERWDLAPGEAISQSQPIRALQGSRTLLCPAPTLDTDEFIAHNAFSEDCSSIDSLADFDLAPGEVRSQSPYRALHGSQVPYCPPPTLDTQEFEKGLESVDPWIVEDSQAPAESRSQGPLDLQNVPNQFRSPSLDLQEFENNRLFSGDMVEDSLPPWDSAPNNSKLERPAEQFYDSKSRHFSSVDVSDTTDRLSDYEEDKVVPVPNSTRVNCVAEAGIGSKMGSKLVVPVSTSASKRSLISISEQGDSRKQVKLESGANFSDEFKSLFPVPPTGTSICGEGHGKVPKSRATESPREQNLKVAEREVHVLGQCLPQNLGPILLPPQNHMPPATFPSTMSDTEPGANNAGNVFCNTSLVRKSSLIDITNSKAFEARSATESKCTEKTLGSPTKKLAEHCRNLSRERVLPPTRDELSENHDAVSPPEEKTVSTIPRRHPAKNGVISDSNEECHRMKVADGDARSLGENTGNGAQVKTNVQTSLGFLPVTSRKSGRQDDERDTDRWLCPRAGKKFVPTLRQLSLDRWAT